MDKISGQLKNESKSDLFSEPGDAQWSENRTAINAFSGAFDDTIQSSPDNTPEIAPKGALQDL